MKAAKEAADRQFTGAKATILKLNKEVTKQKSQSELFKTSLEKTKKEVESIKSKKASASEKEIKELKEANKSATLELGSTKTRVENLSNMLKIHKKKYNQLNAKLLEASAKENEAKAALKKVKDDHQKLMKVHESLKNAMKDRKDQGAEQMKKSSEAKIKETSYPQQSESKEASSNNSTKSDIPLPPLPKVPDGGFKYAPSKPKIDNETKDENMMRNVEEKEVAKKSIVAEAPNKGSLAQSQAKSQESVDTKSKKVPKSTPSTGQKTPVETSTQLKQVTPKNPKSTSAKKDVKTPLKDAEGAKSASNALTKKVTSMSNSKSTNEVNSSTSQNKVQVTTTQAKEEDKASVLREKLMKRKRELAKKLEAKNTGKKIAISSTSDTPVAIPKEVLSSSSDKQKTENIDALKKNPKDSLVIKAVDDKELPSSEKSVANIAEQPKECASDEAKKLDGSVVNSNDSKKMDEGEKATKEPQSDQTAEAKSTELKVTNKSRKIEPVSDVEKNEENIQTNSKPNPFATFGSGKPITFGSFGGLNAAAKPFAPAFASGGAKPVGSNQEGSSAFLNLKPPGKGQSAPLIFGSSSNIKLPTPSKNANVPGQQDSNLFGNVGFGSSSKPFGSNVAFGGGFTQPSKKRSLEPDEGAIDEESAKKQTRIEGDNEENQGKPEVEETNTISQGEK